jgi:rhodanese-related sulfurtransferase
MPDTNLNVAPSAVREITVAAVTALLAADGEHAVIDVREEGVFTRDGHLFAAVPVPLSRLELRIGILVPRSATTIVVIDAGDG